MIKLKNVRPGVLIVADAGLRLDARLRCIEEALGLPQEGARAFAGVMARIRREEHGGERSSSFRRVDQSADIPPQGIGAELATNLRHDLRHPARAGTGGNPNQRCLCSTPGKRRAERKMQAAAAERTANRLSNPQCP